jgi:hypothetical protein
LESARLLTKDIDIESERRQLQAKGMPWGQIYDRLRNKYYDYSKKNAFHCICCNEPVIMVLRESTACYFRHENNCVSSKNYKEYTARVREFEKEKHYTGKSIIKDQLKAALSRRGALVTDGYLYKSELRFIPDVIVQWPDGSVWSFDYITGTKSAKYQSYLVKKQNAYREKGFKSYFFFDAEMIAPYRANYVTALALTPAERGALEFLPRNHAWEGIIEDIIDTYGDENLLVTGPELMLRDRLLYRLMYFTTDFGGILYKVSPLKLRPNVNRPPLPEQWYISIGEKQQIPIDELFKLHVEKKTFTWESDEINEHEFFQFTRRIEDRYKAELEQKEKEEKERKQREEEERKLQEDEKRRREDEIERQNANMSRRTYMETLQRKRQAYKKINDYLATIKRMKHETELLESAPGFIERIKEAEEDIRTFQKTGIVPKRIEGIISMMKYAMGDK